MKHIERLGREFAENWAKPIISKEGEDALAHAYECGFRKARELAADMVEMFKYTNTAILIRAIGERRVEEDQEDSCEDSAEKKGK